MTQPHPHGQIYAFPFVTPDSRRRLAQAADYRRRKPAAISTTTRWPRDRAGERACRCGRRIPGLHSCRYELIEPYEVHLHPNRRIGI